MKKCLLLLYIACLPLHAQKERTIDSLERLYLPASLDRKLELSDHLFELYIYHQPEKVRPKLKELLALSEREQSKRGILNAYQNYMSLYNVQAIFDSTLYYGDRALELIAELKDSTQYNIVHQNLIWAYSVLGDFEKAEELSRKDLEISRKTNQWDALAKSYFGLGNTLFYQNAFSEAIRAYQRVDSILAIHDPMQKTLVNNNINIAQLCFIQKDFTAAIPYLDRAEKVSRHHDHAYGIATVNLYRGIILKETGHPAEGIPFFEKAREFYEGFDSDYDLAELYYHLGDAYYDLGDYKIASLYHQKSLPLQEKVQNPMGIANVQFTLGRIARVEGNTALAMDYVQKALEIYTSMNDQHTVEQKGEVFKVMSELHREEGDFQQSLSYLERHMALKDTLLKQRNQQAFKELESKYQSEKKEQEIALLTARSEISEKEKTNQRNLLGTLLLLSMSGVGFVYYGYRNKLKTAQKLRDLDDLKSRFFANISHEFRTPLTLIKSPLQSLLASDIPPESTQKVQLAEQSANRMLELVDQLLELSRLDAGNMKLLLKKLPLRAQLSAFIAPFQYEAEHSNRSFNSELKLGEGLFWADKDVLEKIMGNLLSNALKYTPEQEMISFRASIDQTTLHLQVRNTGVVISEAEASRLFERFYQRSEHQPGAGIGLALVKELVSLYKGMVRAERGANDLTFHVTLPLDPEVLKGVAVLSEARESEAPSPEHVEFADGKPVLLIAEDHPDIRRVVADLFSDTFTLLQASHGKEALKIAKKEVPDLIISDVMMPKMDGLQLTQALKEEDLTAAIPVILLTAKTEEADRIQALENKADAYITKPFNNQVLQATVQNLLGERARLRERYSRELVLKPMDLVIHSADEKFLARLQRIIDEDIQNPGFTAELFAQTVGMSRMQLHRKLKTLTGLSATEFIRKERLKLAATLLENPALSVSEIAFSVGFNDADYFSKCFKEEFGVTPSKYQPPS